MEIIGIRLVLSIINLVILIYLMSIFISKYVKIRSDFILGFLLFSLALFMRTLFASPIIKILIFGIAEPSIVDPYRLVADVFELFALIILLFVCPRWS